MASQACDRSGCQRRPCCLSPTTAGLLPACAEAAAGPGALPMAPAGLPTAEWPLSTPRDRVYREKFQPVAGAPSRNHFLMGGS